MNINNKTLSIVDFLRYFIHRLDRHWVNTDRKRDQSNVVIYLRQPNSNRGTRSACLEGVENGDFSNFFLKYHLGAVIKANGRVKKKKKI